MFVDKELTIIMINMLKKIEEKDGQLRGKNGNFN